MRLVLLALASLLLAAPALAVVSPPLHLVRAAVGEDCGIAPVPVGKVVAGLNCGNGGFSWGMTCQVTQGGWNCITTAYGEVGISRWINAGSASFTLSGDCAASAGMTWGAEAGAVPAAVFSDCSNGFFWPAGTCRPFSTILTTTFTGNDAPTLPAQTFGFTMCR